MEKKEQVISVLKKYRAAFHPVVAFDAENEKLLPLDFTTGNNELTASILGNTEQFIHHINQKLNHAGAKYGIGGYAENRTIYSVSSLFDSYQKVSPIAGELEGAEPRRLHLGTDIWGKPHTSVMAPWDAVVHSFAFNNNFGDYGATIILTHNLDGVSFHTLYGHLCLNDIKNLEGGERIQKGDVFAEFGIPTDNGHWPPHLHFQIIIDLENWSGDYPGVCKYSEKEKYLTNCPDPDLILQMNKYVSV